MGKVNEEQMQLAIKAYRSENISFESAAKRYGVKITTLKDRVNGSSNKVGRPTRLSGFTEALIVELLGSCSDCGVSLNRNETIDVVESYLRMTKQTNLFPNGRPGDSWYYDFMERHRDALSIRTSSNMPCNRAMSCDPVMFKSWFEKIETIYDEKNFHEKPCHIWNCDEIGMVCDKGKFKVVARRGSQSTKVLSSSNEKIMFTVLVCCSAIGEFLMPHVVISNQTVSTLVNSVESIFKIKYKMPEKEFNNTTFQAGIIMNGAENRAAHEKKLKEIQDKKDQVEANKKKRAEARKRIDEEDAAFAEAKKNNSKLSRRAFNKARRPNQDENTDPSSSIEPSSSIQSGQSVKFQCYVCKDLLNDQPIDKRKFWKVCKDCDNWICGTCEAAIQFEFDSERVESDEFYCQQCFICK